MASRTGDKNCCEPRHHAENGDRCVQCGDTNRPFGPNAGRNNHLRSDRVCAIRLHIIALWEGTTAQRLGVVHWHTLFGSAGITSTTMSLATACAASLIARQTRSSHLLFSAPTQAATAVSSSKRSVTVLFGILSKSTSVGRAPGTLDGTTWSASSAHTLLQCDFDTVCPNE